MLKNEIRKTVTGRLNMLTGGEKKIKSTKICGEILKDAVFKEAKNILIFAGTKNEPDLFSLTALAKEKNFFLPICTGEGEMEAAKFSSKEELAPGKFGILEPTPPEIILPQSLDLIIAPCVAFDRKMNRLGHGGGYYDRFLSKCKEAKIYLVAFCEQEVPEVPADEWDVRMQKIFIA